MKKSFKPSQVINGTWGEVWMDGEYLAQVKALKAEITIKTTAIGMVQTLREGQKMTGMELKGEIKLHKINSFIMKKMSECFRQGKMMTCKIVSNLQDPDALVENVWRYMTACLIKLFLPIGKKGKWERRAIVLHLGIGKS